MTVTVPPDASDVLAALEEKYKAINNTVDLARAMKNDGYRDEVGEAVEALRINAPWLFVLARWALSERGTSAEPPPCDVCGSPNEPSENKCEGCAKPICEDHTHYDVERIPFCEVCWDELAADGEHAEKDDGSAS